VETVERTADLLISTRSGLLDSDAKPVEAAMIRGVHTMFYSSQPDAFRAFVRDKLGFTSHTDVGEGWLIFDLPEADMGCHPAGTQEGETSGTQNISFYCDDVHKTVAELKGRGVEFVDSVEDHGYGLVTHFKAPGDFVIQLYQPKYAKGGPQVVDG
jgi:catechol 2,3-dioxygenase-like lactoylglutathione lyase family enzyme